MNAAVSMPARFRSARQRAGLSIAEVAIRTGISESAVWDLETYDDELATVYSPAELQRFARALSVTPRDLLGTDERNDPISADELASAIREHCQARRMSLDEFGRLTGWDLNDAAGIPRVLMSMISIDGIIDISRELGIDWRRFISSLSAST